MCARCWILALVLSVITGGMIFKFIISGSVEPASDGRQSLQVSAAERDFVLNEMRTFLASVQGITQGLTTDDMDSIVSAARRVGAAAQQGVPGALMGKLPLEFKKLGLDTHRKFDQLALDAEQLGDHEYTLKQLSELMNNCVACHATYRIDVVVE